MIVAQDVAKADPDGYTRFPSIRRKTSPASPLTGASPLAVAVNPSFAAHSVAEVITMARADPGKIHFGTGGLSTTPHMTAEVFEHDAGIKLVHVAYRGEAGATNDLLAGQIPLMFANLPWAISKAALYVALAVTSAKRSPSVPEIPTIAESGLPGFAAETWFGIVAPAGTPADIRSKLNAAARARRYPGAIRRTRHDHRQQ